MDKEFKQYCTLVKLWVWAEDEKHAEEIADEEMRFLIGVDNPAVGFAIVEVNEDGEV